MSRPSEKPRARWRRQLVLLAAVLGIAVAVALAAVVSGATNKPRGADDPLFHDTMADVQVPGATRIDRTVWRQTPATSASKGIQEPSLMMGFQTGGPRSADIAVRDDLVRQAKAAGWTYKSDVPDEEGRMFGYKTIAGQTARLSVFFSSTEQNVVVLRLIYRTP